MKRYAIIFGVALLAIYAANNVDMVKNLVATK